MIGVLKNRIQPLADTVAWQGCFIDVAHTEIDVDVVAKVDGKIRHHAVHR